MRLLRSPGQPLIFASVSAGVVFYWCDPGSSPRAFRPAVAPGIAVPTLSAAESSLSESCAKKIRLASLPGSCVQSYSERERMLADRPRLANTLDKLAGRQGTRVQHSAGAVTGRKAFLRDRFLLGHEERILGRSKSRPPETVPGYSSEFRLMNSINSSAWQKARPVTVSAQP